MDPASIPLLNANKAIHLQKVLRHADHLLEGLDQQGYVSVLATFLNVRLKPQTDYPVSDSIQDGSFRICFACGGSGKRWSNFLGIPKQFVDIGEDIPLIHYSVQQFLSKISPASTCLLIDRNQRRFYSSIRGVNLIDRNGDPEDDVAFEILDNQSLVAHEDQDILLLMGDVAWSSNAVSQVVQHARETKTLTLFGRSKKNELHGNNGGEIFGAFVPARERNNIGNLYEICRSLYHGNTVVGMTRFSTWEVLALLTAAGSISGKSSLREITSSDYHYPVTQLLKLMNESLCNGEFMEKVWIEIDDETEDFDYPFEYLMWLRRKVRKLGSMSL